MDWTKQKMREVSDRLSSTSVASVVQNDIEGLKDSELVVVQSTIGFLAK